MKVIDIDSRMCTGCGECRNVCPVEAISGTKGEPHIIDTRKCVMCGQCVQKCKAYLTEYEQGREIYDAVRSERGIPDTVNEPLFAAYNVTHLGEVMAALKNKDIYTMVQCAPAVRASLYEEFSWECNESRQYAGDLKDEEDTAINAGKLAACLRAVGFDRVYDTNFAADLTIIEEGTELVSRVINGGVLPMFTSCCPAWVRYIEYTYPELIPNLSSCKSPQQMNGSLFKTYAAARENIAAEQIFSVAVMPCTCKEYECSREEMKDSGERDVDAVITTRELAWLIKNRGIDYNNIEPDGFDRLLGEYTGAGTIFAVTGGVAEAALRTVYKVISGQEAMSDDSCASILALGQMEEYKAIERNEQISDINSMVPQRQEIESELPGLRLSELSIGSLTLRIGVVAGLKYMEGILEAIKSGQLKLTFLEVMTCPEGCISGGGQPKLLIDTDRPESIEKRRMLTKEHDVRLQYRRSHENEGIKRLYNEFLSEPGSERAHHLLHTQYREKNNV